jgi:hypothetical protein
MALENTFTIVDGQATAPATGTVPSLAGILPRSVTVAMVTEAAAYLTGEVIAITTLAAAVCPYDDKPAILQSLVLTDVDDLKAALDVVFLTANTSMGAINTTTDPDDTEVQDIQGWVSFGTGDYVDWGGASSAQRHGIGMVLKPATGTDDVYVAIVARQGVTYTSTGALKLRLGLL